MWLHFVLWFYAGGGWTLAVSISSKNNDHLQSAANNCLNSVLCVPFTDKNQGRKLSDSDIHEVAKEEGEYEKKTNNNNDNNNKNGFDQSAFWVDILCLNSSFFMCIITFLFVTHYKLLSRPLPIQCCIFAAQR